MYFAAGLFLTTGIVVVIVSLLTQPPRDYMVIFLIDYTVTFSVEIKW